MSEEYDKIKSNITLILAFMTFLLVFCFALYSKLYDKQEIEIQKSIELSGGHDIISKNLQGIIPYVNITNKDIKTAYQDSIVSHMDIDNDIFLLKAIKITEDLKLNNILSLLTSMYGNNLFIVNHDFNINGINECIFNASEKKYNCEIKEYDGIIYTSFRKIKNISINNNDYYLTEQLVFYSIETINSNKVYKIYSDYTYNNLIIEITDTDLSDMNTTFDTYIMNNYTNNANIYRSKFVLENNNYKWINTERLK